MLCAIIAVGRLMGCEESKSAPPPVAVAVKSGTGAVRGTVKLLIPPPVMAEIANQPCHDGAGPLKEETVVTGPSGELKNVVVYVKGAANGDGASAVPTVMDQKDCRYVPHVIAVQRNQPVIFRSSDPALHNVHYSPDKNPAANFAMTGIGQQRQATFAAAEFFRVKCDVHPWMTGYVAVLDNPWFAVTGDDGTFALNGLPNQVVTIAAWHEHYGSIERQVDLSKNEPVEVSFEIK